MMAEKYFQEEGAKKNAKKERVEKEIASVDDTNNVPQRSGKK